MTGIDFKATNLQLTQAVSLYCDMTEKVFGMSEDPEVRKYLFRSTFAHVKLINEAYGKVHAEKSLFSHLTEGRYATGEFIS